MSPKDHGMYLREYPLPKGMVNDAQYSRLDSDLAERFRGHTLKCCITFTATDTPVEVSIDNIDLEIQPSSPKITITQDIYRQAGFERYNGNNLMNIERKTKYGKNREHQLYAIINILEVNPCS